LTFPKSYALRSQLSWTHYRLLMRVEDNAAREFYLDECAKSNWSTRQLERQINSFYYQRLLSSTNIENWLTSIGICDIAIIEFNNLDLIIEGVISGLGVSFVPESYIQKQKELGILNVFPIPTKYSSTRTFLIRHKNNFMTSTLSKFIELVQLNIPIHKPKPSN